jgi:hypothetical protein
MESWGTFAVIVGSTAAALLGLLFVAVSIKVDIIGDSAELRNRTAQTLGLFVTVLFIALLLATPGQSLHVLGAELIARSCGRHCSLRPRPPRAIGVKHRAARSATRCGRT